MISQDPTAEGLPEVSRDFELLYSDRVLNCEDS